MKPDSDYFSKIRMRRRGPVPPVAKRVCEMSGCVAAGEHRAPKGRQAEGEYFWFCLEHVRSYNKSYNYFNGMKDDDLVAYQKAATIGHRPTWRMGVNASGEDAPPPAGRAKFGWGSGARDPFQVFGDSFQTRRPEPESQRKVRNMEMRSLKTLGLDEQASPAEVKARYKLLVKRHHPDANGGDRSLEERLREIIQAYSYLKSAGFC